MQARQEEARTPKGTVYIQWISRERTKCNVVIMSVPERKSVQQQHLLGMF